MCHLESLESLRQHGSMPSLPMLKVLHWRQGLPAVQNLCQPLTNIVLCRPFLPAVVWSQCHLLLCAPDLCWHQHILWRCGAPVRGTSCKRCPDDCYHRDCLCGGQVWAALHAADGIMHRVWGGYCCRHPVCLHCRAQFPQPGLWTFDSLHCPGEHSSASSLHIWSMPASTSFADFGRVHYLHAL